MSILDQKRFDLHRTWIFMRENTIFSPDTDWGKTWFDKIKESNKKEAMFQQMLAEYHTELVQSIEAEIPHLLEGLPGVLSEPL